VVLNSEVTCKCGIFVGHTIHDVYKGLKALQHRGQDSVGIAVKKNGHIDLIRWSGKVGDFSLESLVNILGSGELVIGHVRYNTMKIKENAGLFSGAHPRFIGGKIVDNSAMYKSHLIVRDADKAIVHNGNIPDLYLPEGKIDTDIILEEYSKKGISFILETFSASYSAAILDSKINEAIIFRDRYKMRPLWIGEKDGNILASSEDVAIWEVGGKPIREVNGGEVIHIPQRGRDFVSEQIINSKQRVCFFEGNYLQSASSSFDGRTIFSIRRNLGRQLAKEYFPEVDFVSFIPHSPEHIARGYSDERKIPLKEIFYKVASERSFLGESQSKRDISIGTNLFVLDNVNLEGKRILIFDDSLVRGTVSKDATKKLREKGVAWIGLALGTPIIGPIVNGIQRGCLWGVDIPPEDNFAIKRAGTFEKLKEETGFDDVYFISMDGLARAHGKNINEMCTYCIGGENPIEE
jgi:amidophosphoribosyltransferase